MTATQTQLLESKTINGRYGLSYIVAIVEDSEIGRLLIAEGYGGENTLDGGAYRWEHGVAYKINETDTIESLETAEWNEFSSVLEAILSGNSKHQPAYHQGSSVATIAKRAEL